MGPAGSPLGHAPASQRHAGVQLRPRSGHLGPPSQPARPATSMPIELGRRSTSSTNGGRRTPDVPRPGPPRRLPTPTRQTPRRRRDPQTRSPRVRVAVSLRLPQRSLPRRPPVLATPANSGSACGAADAGPCGSSAYLFAVWPPIVDGGPLRARPRPPLRSGPKARPRVELSARKLPLTSRAVSAEIRWTAPLTAGARLRLPE